MSESRVGLAAPYRWLSEAFALCRKQPRVVFGAAFGLLVVALLPTLAQLLVEAAMQPSGNARLVVQGLFMLVGLVVFPPIVGGFYRIVHAVHEGRPVAALDLFAIFRDTAAARRLILANLMVVLISIGLVVGLGYALGGQELLGFLRELATLKPGATQLPALPDGAVAFISLVIILGLVITTAQGVATCQVALTERQPLAAIGDGFGVALRNIAAFLLFYLPMAVVGLVIGLIGALVVALIGMAMSVVSPVLALLLILPFGLLLMVLLYGLMFSFYYQAWRDTLGANSSAQPQHQIIA